MKFGIQEDQLMLLLGTEFSCRTVQYGRIVSFEDKCLFKIIVATSLVLQIESHM